MDRVDIYINKGRTKNTEHYVFEGSTVDTINYIKDKKAEFKQEILELHNVKPKNVDKFLEKNMVVTYDDDFVRGIIRERFDIFDWNLYMIWTAAKEG